MQTGKSPYRRHRKTPANYSRLLAAFPYLDPNNAGRGYPNRALARSWIEHFAPREKQAELLQRIGRPSGGAS